MVTYHLRIFFFSFVASFGHINEWPTPKLATSSQKWNKQHFFYSVANIFNVKPMIKLAHKTKRPQHFCVTISLTHWFFSSAFSVCFFKYVREFWRTLETSRCLLRATLNRWHHIHTSMNQINDQKLWWANMFSAWSRDTIVFTFSN